MLQSDKTLAFWDDYHEENLTQEWILQPTAELIDMILCQVPMNDANDAKPLYILEIGCGTSTLAREVFAELKSKHPKLAVHMTATDVSRVCIDLNSQRDAQLISRNDQFHRIQYQYLNVLEPNLVDSESSSDKRTSGIDKNKFDLILDKGCMDTFSFRSRQRGSNQAYSDILVQALNNIHSWLKPTGRYLFMSPRTNIKGVRDFVGFSKVSRQVVPTPKAEIVGSKNQAPTFLYTCIKNEAYDASSDSPFQNRVRDYGVPDDDDGCKKCHLSFLDFRQGQGIDSKGGETFWIREWNGHCKHCKGK